MRRAVLGLAFLVPWMCLAAVNVWPGDGMTPPETRAGKSAPPDKTNYSRKAVPEDTAPGGKPAIGPNVETNRGGAAAPKQSGQPESAPTVGPGTN